jgi:crotonobetainyl-CoA:carnitine CoA-transferase CaiB-like acyl-CoA transferase
MATRTTAQWTEVLMAADIPTMPMHTMDSLMDDPHLKATGFFEQQQHPTEGAIRSMRAPARWSRTQPRQRSFAPRLGEHSEELLREAGYGADEVAALRERGVTTTQPE